MTVCTGRVGCACSQCVPVRFVPPTFTPGPERRADPQPCTDIQLDAVADEYAAYMRAKGVVIGRPEEVAIRRAAAIQDAWRCAFARVLG